MATQVVGRVEQPVLIKSLYCNVIRRIVEKDGIQAFQPSYEVTPDTDVQDVIRNSAWYVAGIGDKRSQPHFRYNRYRLSLNHLGLKADARRPVAHVDLGFGAGLFSWVFLDWAAEKGIDYSRVRLFGYDHNRHCLSLAKRIRKSLTPKIPEYPRLCYFDDVETLLNRLKRHNRSRTDYVITFGHVFVQARSTAATEQFTKIIAHVMELLDYRGTCSLIAVDAKGRSLVLEEQWRDLLRSLSEIGIGNRAVLVPGAASTKAVTLE